MPKIQIITIEELLEERQLEYPRLKPATFKKAPRQHKSKRRTAKPKGEEDP